MNQYVRYTRARAGCSGTTHATAGAYAQLLAQIEQLEQQRECDCRTRDERIEALIEQMRLLKAQLFGRSSEKRTIDEVSPDQTRLIFNEAEAIAHTPMADTAPESVTVPAPARKKSGRKALPSNLPRIEVIHDLPEADKRCAHDGSTLEVIGNANLYSLIETAKANGIEPHAYLTWLYTQLPHATRLEHFEAMLSWNVKAELTASR